MTDATTFLARVYETVAARDLDALVDQFAADCVFVDVPLADTSRGRVAFRAYMEETFRGMPDFRPERWEFVAEGDRVAAELVLVGTHAGEFMDHPATGRVVRWAASAFYTLNAAHDQVVREVYYYDLRSLEMQLVSAAADA